MSEEIPQPYDDYRQALRDLWAVGPRSIVLMWKVSPVTIAIYFVVSIVTAVIPAGLTWMQKVIVDGAVEAAGAGETWHVLLGPICAVLGLWVGQALLSGVSSIVMTWYQHKFDLYTSTQVMEKSATVDFAFFEIPRFYDVQMHAMNSTGSVQALGSQLFGYFNQLVGITSMMLLLTVLHPAAILVLVFTAVPTLVIQPYMARRRYELEIELVRTWRRSSYMQRLMSNRDYVKELRVFSLEDFLLARFEKLRRRVVDRSIRLDIYLTALSGGMQTLSLLGVGGISVYGIVSAANGQITIGELVMVFGAAMQGSQQIQSLARSSGSVFQSLLFATRYFQFLDLEPETIGGALRKPLDESTRPLPRSISQGIVFDNVSFSYPANENVVLDHVSFTIPVGSKLAIVGQNGSGKTTLIKLLTRLYDPTGGRILLDGVDIRDCSVDDLRQKIGVVFQDYYEYDFTAAENIGVGEIQEFENEERIVATAERSGVHSVVEKLPDGYNTLLGKVFDQGTDLSGGEWQHLAITRGLYSDSEILVLDEPTAALDALREHELYTRFADATEGQTVVFISHRFSTVRMADTIIVLEDGRLTENGSHEELLRREGMYAKMFNTQASRFV